MDLKLKVWRQDSADDKGRIEDYDAKNIPAECSFLEMLDLLNEKLLKENQEPVEFDSDCREGICGTCSLVVNGQAHGPERGTGPETAGAPGAAARGRVRGVGAREEPRRHRPLRRPAGAGSPESGPGRGNSTRSRRADRPLRSGKA